MHFKSVFRNLPAAAALLGAAIFSSPAVASAATSHEQVSTLQMKKTVTAALKELRGLVNRLNRDADQLRGLNDSSVVRH